MMQALHPSFDDRGFSAVIATTGVAILFAASIHFHLLCSIHCFHGRDALMTADICHSAARD
ncbi:hypothetical protein Rleg4DRAFT_4586 [Rhizobium leguminosarum bv. trifolii WSM2297]|uniref:Uncharacterized protein n=1 Tax=Rhizobium leguminosarum bv. trifolii WSM2297 TaxID=754762 RepID=J0WAS6_RHILT|nr:hypothetical protein [Rhizobium leguminosarum]EJC82856.1 hypothetical protein Rleg4DRAFT_4586 [Rhizobium leguminosarum bv. trifolii WSM2297]